MAPTRALFDACPLAVERLRALPPILREDPDIRAAVYADAKEAERQEETLAALRAELFPQTATEVGLPIHETLLRIAVASPGLTVQARRDIALGVFRKLRENPTGLDWEEGVSLVLGTNQWTYEEHLPTHRRDVNLAINPSFERDPVGTSLTSTHGWRVSTGAEQPVIAAAAWGRGAQVIHYTPASDVGNEARIRGEAIEPEARGGWIPATPGETYRVQASARNADGVADRRGNVSIFWADSNNAILSAPNQLHGAYTTLPVDGTPVEMVELVGVAPAGAVKLVPGLQVTAVGGGAPLAGAEGFYEWDMLMLVEGDPAPYYFDGDEPDAEWLGAAHASASRNGTDTPPVGVIRITVPFDPNVYDMAAAESRIYEFTPAGWEVQLVSEQGFIVGVSAIGEQPL